jgi:hypothetical protein
MSRRIRLRTSLCTASPSGDPLRIQNSSLCLRASVATEFVAPLFSQPYELLSAQSLYFDNHPRCPGVCGHRSFTNASAIGVQAIQRHCFQRFAASLQLLALFCRVPVFVFNRLQPLFAKHPGVGGMPANSPFEINKMQTLFSALLRIPLAPCAKFGLSCSEAG